MMPTKKSTGVKAKRQAAKVAKSTRGLQAATAKPTPSKTSARQAAKAKAARSKVVSAKVVSAKAASKAAENSAVADTCKRVEALLSKSSAYRKVDLGLYVIKQGSSLVMISVHPWKSNHVVIRLTAQLVKGVSMEVPLALELLELNASMRFGAFAFIPKGNVVVLCHTLLERDVADTREFLDTLADFAIVADEYDDRIAARYGGSTMQDLLEEATMHHIRAGYEKKDFLA